MGLLTEAINIGGMYLPSVREMIEEDQHQDEYYTGLEDNERLEAEKDSRPPIETLLTWSEVWQIGSEAEALGVTMATPSTKKRIREPLWEVGPYSWRYDREPRLGEILSRRERAAFHAWLAATAPQYEALRERERKDHEQAIQKERRREMEAEGGRWWNINI